MYLTFDDGPIPEVTPEVLRILAEYNAKATFFCIGDNVEKHPDVYKQVLDEGHAVGNHTQNHLSGWKTEDYAYFRNTLQSAQHIDSDLFRPPYGRIKRSQATVLKQRYKIIMWDVLSGDFDPKTTQQQCLDNVINNAREGSIIVFHDSLKAQDKMLFALPRVLAHFGELGYRFDTLDGVIK